MTPSFPHSASAILSSQSLLTKPDYKLLHQTHILLRNRIRHSSYRLTYLQTRDTPNSHTSTIYCLQLYTFPDSPECPGRQVLFTGSRDRTIRQWDLSRGVVERVFQGVHEASVLSLCVRRNLIVSGDNDRRVVVWDIKTGEISKVIDDHLDSVLCIRFDDKRLVTCSKGEICGKNRSRYTNSLHFRPDCQDIPLPQPVSTPYFDCPSRGSQCNIYYPYHGSFGIRRSFNPSLGRRNWGIIILLRASPPSWVRHTIALFLYLSSHARLGLHRLILRLHTFSLVHQTITCVCLMLSRLMAGPRRPITSVMCVRHPHRLSVKAAAVVRTMLQGGSA